MIIRMDEWMLWILAAFLEKEKKLITVISVDCCLLWKSKFIKHTQTQTDSNAQSLREAMDKAT